MHWIGTAGCETPSGLLTSGIATTTPRAKPRTVVTGVATELSEFAKLRDEGILTDEEFAEQRNRLPGR